MNGKLSIPLLLAAIGVALGLARVNGPWADPRKTISEASLPNTDAERASSLQENKIVAESPRHADDDLQKYRIQMLTKAIRDQEEIVEERRKVLATIIKTKSIIYRPDVEEEKTSARTNDENEGGAYYSNAQLVLDEDTKVLEHLKRQLAAEQAQMNGK